MIMPCNGPRPSPAVTSGLNQENPCSAGDMVEMRADSVDSADGEATDMNNHTSEHRLR
ncbi:hypothetical protein GCM10027580_17470 [Corynebacterium faecale]